MPRIKYMIADDHKLFRKGLKLILESNSDLECIGEASNGVELLQLLKTKTPDVILLDIKMPEMDGIDALIEIKKENKNINVIILTMYDENPFVVKLMEQGANGYLLKNAEPEEISNAIMKVHQTGFYFNDFVSNSMLQRLVKEPREKNEIIEPELNEREIEVLKLICQEKTAAEIGKTIFLSTRTVEGIRAGLMEKTGAKNIAGLVKYAIKKKYI